MVHLGSSVQKQHMVRRYITPTAARHFDHTHLLLWATVFRLQRRHDTRTQPLPAARLTIPIRRSLGRRIALLALRILCSRRTPLRTQTALVDQLLLLGSTATLVLSSLPSNTRQHHRRGLPTVCPTHTTSTAPIRHSRLVRFKRLFCLQQNTALLHHTPCKCPRQNPLRYTSHLHRGRRPLKFCRTLFLRLRSMMVPVPSPAMTPLRRWCCRRSRRYLQALLRRISVRQRRRHRQPQIDHFLRQ